MTPLVFVQESKPVFLIGSWWQMTLEIFTPEILRNMTVERLQYIVVDHMSDPRSQNAVIYYGCYGV